MNRYACGLIVAGTVALAASAYAASGDTARVPPNVGATEVPPASPPAAPPAPPPAAFPVIVIPAAIAVGVGIGLATEENDSVQPSGTGTGTR